MMSLDGLLLGSAVRSRELKFPILMGLFQHEIFYDSILVSMKFLCRIFIILWRSNFNIQKVEHKSDVLKF